MSAAPGAQPGAGVPAQLPIVPPGTVPELPGGGMAGPPVPDMPGQ
jgi:hypothetical protein